MARARNKPCSPGLGSRGLQIRSPGVCLPSSPYAQQNFRIRSSPMDRCRSAASVHLRSHRQPWCWTSPPGRNSLDIKNTSGFQKGAKKVATGCQHASTQQAHRHSYSQVRIIEGNARHPSTKLVHGDLGLARRIFSCVRPPAEPTVVRLPLAGETAGTATQSCHSVWHIRRGCSRKWSDRQ